MIGNDKRLADKKNDFVRLKLRKLLKNLRFPNLVILCGRREGDHVTRPAFESWRSYWSFRESVTRRYRYAHEQPAEEFLDVLRATAADRVMLLNAGTTIWRSQLGSAGEPICDEKGEAIDEAPFPYPPERMFPLNDRADEGRANPKGIPVFYGATDRATAIGEVRPWVGSQISVGEFRVERELRLVNLIASGTKWLIFLSEPDEATREEQVWRDIDRAFARPVQRSDDTADYAPTQIIAETLRGAGFDGLTYRSSLGTGQNFAIFHPTDLKLIRCEVHELKAIQLSFDESGNSYFMRRDSDE